MVSKVFDASQPPMTAPPGCAGVMGYIGERGRTPHVWTAQEWQRFRELKQFPVCLPDFTWDGTVNAQLMVSAAQARGWAAHEEFARVIVIDMETRVDPKWYYGAAIGVIRAGFTPVCYGSLSTVFGNEAVDVIAADFNRDAVIPQGQTLHGWQYLAEQPWDNTVVDYSSFDQWLMDRGGVGPRK